jgi:hypothetical protein
MSYMAACVVSLNSKVEDLNVTAWHYITLAVVLVSHIFVLSFEVHAHHIHQFDHNKCLILQMRVLVSVFSLHFLNCRSLFCK